MQLSKEQEQAVLEMAAKDLADRTWAKIESQVEEVTTFSVARASGMLDLSTAQTRRVLEEHIDFGPRDARVSLAQLKRLVSKRTVRAAKQKGRRSLA